MLARLARHAAALTQATGFLLAALGVIHLIATPFLMGWLGRQVHSDNAALAIAAMRLNFLLAGILLIALGVSTIWAGKSLTQPWALRLATLSAATLLCLPVLVVTTMPVESLDAPLFRLAVIVLIIACLVQLAAVVGLWQSRRLPRSIHREGP
jgi:peptidoglycan/LPS O-acetylase OafA/YrhL